MAKILFITQSDTGAVDLTSLYNSIKDLDCHQTDIKIVNKDERSNLEKYIYENIEITQYDWVVIFIRLKHLVKQVSFLKTINNLIFFDHDVCQNYIKSSKYFGCYRKFYKKIKHCHVIVSGYQLSQKLIDEGVSAHYMIKGCDTKLVLAPKVNKNNLITFIGSTKAHTYKTRRLFIDKIKKQIPEIKIENKLSKAEYFKTLSNTTFFLCPDIDFGEYMIKNFEAMASGCVLLTYNQGDDENQKLGLVDKENVVLFSNIDDCIDSFCYLKDNPEECSKISQKAIEHAKKNFDFSHAANVFSKIIHSLSTSEQEKKILKRKWWQIKL